MKIPVILVKGGLFLEVGKLVSHEELLELAGKSNVDEDFYDEKLMVKYYERKGGKGGKVGKGVEGGKGRGGRGEKTKRGKRETLKNGVRRRDSDSDSDTSDSSSSGDESESGDGRDSSDDHDSVSSLSSPATLGMREIEEEGKSKLAKKNEKEKEEDEKEKEKEKDSRENSEHTNTLGEKIKRKKSYQVLRLDDAKEVRAFTAVSHTIYFSHQWLSSDSPDPNGHQFKVMQRVVEREAEELGCEVDDIFVWVDYCSLPQNDGHIVVAPLGAGETKEQKYMNLAFNALPFVVSNLKR